MPGKRIYVDDRFNIVTNNEMVPVRTMTTVPSGETDEWIASSLTMRAVGYSQFSCGVLLGQPATSQTCARCFLFGLIWCSCGIDCGLRALSAT